MTLYLVIAFAIVLSVTRAIRAQDNWYISVLFTNPDGSPCVQPCLFGIRPGITSRLEAEKLAQKHPLTRNIQMRILADGGLRSFSNEYLDLTFTSHNEPRWVRFTVKEFSHSTGSILASFLQHQGNLGDTIKFFGEPDYIQLSAETYVFGAVSQTFYLKHRLSTIHLRSEVHRVNPTDTLFQITVVQDSPTFSLETYNYRNIDMRPVQWQKFGATDIYPRKLLPTLTPTNAR